MNILLFFNRKYFLKLKNSDEYFINPSEFFFFFETIPFLELYSPLVDVLSNRIS